MSSTFDGEPPDEWIDRERREWEADAAALRPDGEPPDPSDGPPASAHDDLADMYAAEDARRSTEPAATAPPKQAGKGGGNGKDRPPAFRILTGDELLSKGAPIPWIDGWRGWLPEAMFTLLASEKGMGKTTLIVGASACLTTGRVPWSDVRGAPKRVLYWSGEDDIRVLVGKAIAAGMDFDRFGVIDGRTIETDGKRIDRPFEPSTDMPLLLEHIKADPPDVIIIDPIIRMLTGKNNSAEDVRRAIDPVVAQAERIGISTIGLGHFAKGSGDRPIIERYLGSQAWTARARMVWSIVKAGERHLFGKAITNLATDCGVIDIAIEEQRVTFQTGETDMATKIEFGELNTDENLVLCQLCIDG